MKVKVMPYSLFVLSLMAGVLGSCGEDDGPSPAQVSLEMKANTSLSTLKTGRKKNGNLEFVEVLIGVTELEFETADENEQENAGQFQDADNDGEDDNEEVEFEGEFAVDMINGTSNPSFEVANTTAGIYEEIELELGPVLDGGNTMFIAFDFLPEGSQEMRRVEYSNTLALELEFERDNGFDLNGGALTQLLVLLDLDALFVGINLNSATVDLDGVVRINADSNAVLANSILDNISNAVKAGEDDNDDGEIDD